MHMTHIGYDDWAGLYVDGRLYMEGHSIQMGEIERAAEGRPFTFEDATVDEGLWYSMLDDHGCRLPERWEDAEIAVEKS